MLPEANLVDQSPVERGPRIDSSPDKPSQAVRCLPIRSGRLAVPPAPGTSPRPTSGSWKKASSCHDPPREGGELGAGADTGPK